MRRVVSAREQVEMLSPWSREAAGRLRLPQVKANTLDDMGITQRKLNGNFLSWLSEADDRRKEEGLLWYPVGHDWGAHISDRHDEHTDKVYGVMSKTSPQRDWINNIGDSHNIVSNFRMNPSGIITPGGISGSDNLRQSMRIMSAADDPDAIHEAFMGGKRPRDIPKTLDFYRTLRNPEEGGAFNYMDQPGVVDSWMGRTMLWTKNRWEDANSGGRPLTWPGKGTGKGLDKHVVVKKKDPESGLYRPVGTRPPNARDVALRAIKYGGGYDRMRNAMRNGAAVVGMPYTHGAQAAVWNMIGGTPNPEHVAHPDVDLHDIDHPTDLYNELWARHASGLHVPTGLITSSRKIAHGNVPEDIDTLDEDWGAEQDISEMLSHVQLGDQGWDYWEDRPRSLQED